MINNINAINMFEDFSNSFLRDFNFDKFIEKFEQKNFLHYSENEFIYFEKDFITNVYFILSGEVNICRLENIQIKEVISKAKAGDVIGFDDVLVGDYYLNSSYAAAETNVIEINKNEFIELTKKNDEFNLWTLKYLCNKLSSLD